MNRFGDVKSGLSPEEIQKYATTPSPLLPVLIFWVMFTGEMNVPSDLRLRTMRKRLLELHASRQSKHRDHQSLIPKKRCLQLGCFLKSRKELTITVTGNLSVIVF